MGLKLNKGALPATPATNKVEIVMDTADNRVKAVDYLGTVNVLSPDGMDRNYLVNGGFAINQRIAAALTNIPSPSTTGRVFTADRWGFTIGNVTTPQYQQVDTITAPETGITSRFYARYKQLTNAAKMCISQVIPGVETARLRGRNVRLQVSMRYSAGSNRAIRVGLLQLTSAGTVDTIPATFISAFNGASTDPTFGTNLTPIVPNTTGIDNATVIGNFMNCNITLSWQRFSGIFTIPTNCLNLIVVIFNDSVGAASDDLLITQVDLHDGQEIFDWTSYGADIELLRCQRYFCKTFLQGTVPVAGAGINTGEAKGIAGKAGAVANAGFIYWRFPVTMFKTPGTVTLFGPVTTTVVRDETAGVDHTSSVVAGTTDAGTRVTSTGNASTAVGDEIGLHITADAEP